MRFADKAGRQAGPVSKPHGSRRPDPRAGVKAREAPRVAGLALTPSTDQALAADGSDNLDENDRPPARVQARCLKRQLSLPVSTMSQWWVRRSSNAVVILGSPKTLGHSPKARLVVTMMDVRS